VDRPHGEVTKMDNVDAVETALFLDEVKHGDELDIDYTLHNDNTWCLLYTFVDDVQHKLEFTLQEKGLCQIYLKIQDFRDFVKGHKEPEDQEANFTDSNSLKL
jgi:hypothetical protein